MIIIFPCFVLCFCHKTLRGLEICGNYAYTFNTCFLKGKRHLNCLKIIDDVYNKKMHIKIGKKNMHKHCFEGETISLVPGVLV